MTSGTGGELFTDYSDHPRKTVTLTRKTQLAGVFDAVRLLPAGGTAFTVQLIPKDFLRKSGRCGNTGDWRAYATMIDRGDIRQAIDRCSKIRLPPGAGYGQFDTRLTA